MHSGSELSSQGKTTPPKGPRDRDQDRDWFCRTCAHQETGPEMPVGWYRLDRKITYADSSANPHMRLGLFCTIVCVVKQAPRLAGIEAEMDAGNIDPATFETIARRR